MTAADATDRRTGMLCHLMGLLAYLIPIAGLIATLVFWLFKKEVSEFADQQGREAVNFQITILISSAVMIPLCLLLVGLLGLAVIAVYGFAMTVIGSVRASDGQAFRYPISLRLL